MISSQRVGGPATRLHADMLPHRAITARRCFVATSRVEVPANALTAVGGGALADQFPWQLGMAALVLALPVSLAVSLLLFGFLLNCVQMLFQGLKSIAHLLLLRISVLFLVPAAA